MQTEPSNQGRYPQSKTSASSMLKFGVDEISVFVEPLCQQGGSHEQEVYRDTHGR